jgi:putative ABC transport system permease protein
MGNSGVAAAFALLLVAAGFSRLLDLRLGRALLFSGVRAASQLALLGLVLGWIFKQESHGWTLVAIFGMSAMAVQTVLSRVPLEYRGIRFHVAASVILPCWILSAVGLMAITGFAGLDLPSSLVLPFTGLLLGNCVSGISLGLNDGLKSLRDDPARLEYWLSQGASRWEAIAPVLRDSARTAISPVLNSLSVAGVVSLPGMMTGQLLAGADPGGAVRYQIIAMLLVAVGTLIGAVLALALALLSFFNHRHQFLYSRLAGTGSGVA